MNMEKSSPTCHLGVSALCQTIALVLSVLNACAHGFSDSFSADTIDSYTITDTWTQSGTGSFEYRPSRQQGFLSAPDNIGIQISRDVDPTDTGSFSFEFNPVAIYPLGGIVAVRLRQDDGTYYQIENTDGYGPRRIEKVIDGVTVASASFNDEFQVGRSYNLEFFFGPTSLRVVGMGDEVRLDTNDFSIRVSSFEIELIQTDAFIDNISFALEGPRPPVANAGPGQTVGEDQLVTLDGSSSSDDGVIVSYQWEQVAGPSTIVFEEEGATTTFTAPKTSGVSETYLFNLIVTDDEGLSSSDVISVSVLSDGVLTKDEFTSDTTGEYVVTDTWTQSGTGTFQYDAPGERGLLTSGDNIGISIKKFVMPTDTGSFSFDFMPTRIYPLGGILRIRLRQDDETFYQIENTDGYGPRRVTKIIAGSEVSSQSFASEFSHTNSFALNIQFSANELTLSGMGSNIRLANDNTPIVVTSFEIEFVQLDGYLDNIIFNSQQTPTALPPTADPGPDQVVTSGTLVELDGTRSSGNDDEIIEYKWQQLSGPVNLGFPRTGAQVEFVAPEAPAGDSMEFYFQLTVTDSQALSATSDLMLTVVSDRQPPEADAGAAQTVNEGDRVVLDGSNSTDDGTIITYNWQQISGPSMLIFESSSMTPSFSAPLVSSASETYTFELTVTDDEGLSSSATVMVTVLAQSAAFTDTFAFDSTGSYAVTQLYPNRGLGSFTYDAPGKRGFIQTEDNIGIYIERSLPVSESGIFSMQFSPTRIYPAGGILEIRLRESASTYYELENTDGYGPRGVVKYVNGRAVASGQFSEEFSFGENYLLTIAFNADQLRVQGMGDPVIISGGTTPIRVSSVEIEFRQLDGYIDNIGFSSDSTFPPVANAGADQIVIAGDLVTLDGSRSDGPDGASLGWDWQQKSGPVVSFNSTASQPTFIAPSVSYTTDLVFELIVSSSDGQDSTPDTAIVTVQPNGGSPAGDDSDDFSVNTLGNYVIERTTSEGSPSITWDSTRKNLRVVTGDNVGVRLERGVSSSTTGTFEVDVQPTQIYPNSGTITVRLSESTSTYYEYRMSDGLSRGHLKKVINNSTVRQSNTGREYFQGPMFDLNIHFAASRITVGGLMRVISLADPYSRPINVNSVSIEFGQQDGYLDNFRFDPTPGVYLIAFGDSITAGNEDDIFSDGYGYPAILENLLNSASSDHHIIFNEGISGIRSGAAADRMNVVINSHPVASIILVQLGTNDQKDPTVPSGLGSSPPTSGSYKFNIQRIITAAKNAGITPILARMHPLVGSRASRDFIIKEYNQVVDELINENGLQQPPDFHCYFSANPQFLPDGVHPNGEGYVRQAGIWDDSIRSGRYSCSP